MLTLFPPYAPVHNRPPRRCRSPLRSPRYLIPAGSRRGFWQLEPRSYSETVSIGGKSHLLPRVASVLNNLMYLRSGIGDAAGLAFAFCVGQSDEVEEAVIERSKLIQRNE